MSEGEVYDEEAQRAVEAICKERDELKARITELQNELNVVQESERAEAQEADRLRAEVKELKSHNEVLQKRVEEFSMELLDRIMRDNKDVLERLKQAESENNYENYEIESDDE